MRLGVLNTVVGGEPREESFARAAKAGSEGVEIQYGNAKDARTLSRKKLAAEMRKLAESSGLEIPSLSLGFLCKKPSLVGTPEDVTKAQEQIATAISVAGEIGAGVVLVPFFGKNTIEVATELNRAVEALQDLSEKAEDAGVAIGVESKLHSAQRQFLLDSLAAANSVKIYYDTGNALSRKVDVPTDIRDIGRDHIAQIHFKDVRITEGSPPDFNVALGQGSVDFRAVVRALRAVGYDGWIILETNPSRDPIAETTADLEFVRNLILD